jgi:hypothetical protein
MRKNDVVKAMRREAWLEALWKAANIMEHDLHCWESVRDRAGDNEYIRHFANGRIESLRIDCDQIYAACEAINREAKTNDTQTG